MAATSDQRALAQSLAARDDAALIALLADRGVSPSVAWRDLFDAAEALLEPASVTRGLALLPRAAAVALRRAAAAGSTVDPAQREALALAALVDDSGAPLPTAAGAALQSDPVEPDAEASTPAAAPAAQSAAAERAFTHTASLADILLRAFDSPLARIGSGGLGAAERRVLVESGAASDPDTAELLVALAGEVGLLSPGERVWIATPAARTWVTETTATRWERVATGFRAALPAGLRTPTGGWIPVASWPGAFPFDPTWPERAERWRRLADAWGIIADDGGLPEWSIALSAGRTPDTSTLQAVLPTEVDRVFLQNDLTAIAPGFLAPHLDVRLRTMARRESRAQAASYRFDADTVAAAITAGETAESMTAFLRELSLTGLPQPLAYVIERTATRHGLVRVSTDLDTGRARVSSDDATAIATIAVDQALRPLGLVRDGGGLVSRLSADAVFWALADARYPTVAVDADGEQRTPDRARLAPAASVPAPAETYGPLIERLRAASRGDDADAAWLEREVDQAVRARAIVDVVVALPDGSERTFRLEATGFGGGRLRGRDRGADVERTLPLTSIRSVSPVT